MAPTNPLRIAILCLEKGGGIAHCAYELAKALAPIVDVSCFIATQNALLQDFQRLPCKIHAIPMKRGRRALLQSMILGGAISGVANAITAELPDVVLDVGSGGWGGIVLRHLTGRVPIAQIVHDVSPHPGIRSAIDFLPTVIQGRVADIFIGLSDFSFKQLEAKYPNVPCISARHGVIMAAERIDVQAVADRRHKLLFFGRIGAYKGIETLVDAFAIAKLVDHNLKLSIVGDGHLRLSTRRKIRQLGIELDNRRVSDAEIREMVSAHGIMVLPYTSASQSGVAALALANGMPCVATNVGGLPEQVHHGSNGLIVPPRDPQALARALVTIADSVALAMHMAQESVRIGQDTYSWGHIARKLLVDITQYLDDRAITRGLI